MYTTLKLLTSWTGWHPDIRLSPIATSSRSVICSRWR